MSGVRVWTRELMGTVFSVHVVDDASGGPEQRATEDLAAARFFDEVSEIERIFSTFRDDSEVSRIRRGELDIASADPRVGMVAAACDEAESATAGRFSAHWRGGFDPTGYVKGWSVEVAGAAHLEPLLRVPGIRALGVNAGGDVRVWSRPETPWTWRVGVADPARRGSIVATIELTSGAVATSGTAERGGHIIEPASGRPAGGARSATVVGADLATADVWATAAVVAGAEYLSWIGGAPVASGLVVSSDGGVRRFANGVELCIVPAA